MAQILHNSRLLTYTSPCGQCVEIFSITQDGSFKKVTSHALEQRYTRHDLMNVCQNVSVMNKLTGRNYPIRPKLFFNDNIMFRLVVSKVAHCRLVSVPVLVVFERIYIQTLI